MKLSTLERLALISILPARGDFTTLKILRKLKEDLSFNETEHKILNFSKDGDMLRWENDFEKDFTFGEKATDIIVESLKKLNDTKNLRENHYTLYEKFVEGSME